MKNLKTFSTTLLCSLLLSSCLQMGGGGQRIPATSRNNNNITIDNRSRFNEGIWFNPESCVCHNGESYSLAARCGGFCASIGAQTPTLFLELERLAPEIELNPSYRGTVAGWCTAPIDDGQQNPNCRLEVLLPNGLPVNFDVQYLRSGNLVAAEIPSLGFNTNYQARLVEQTSGASSVPHDLLLSAGYTWGSPLSTSFLNNYLCMQFATEEVQGIVTRSTFTGSNNTVGYYFAPLSFYFTSSMSFTPVGQSLQASFACHAGFSFGASEAGYQDHGGARVAQVNNIVKLWSRTNSLFNDLDGNGELDANDEINRILSEPPFNLNANNEIFIPFDQEFTGPPLEGTPLPLGYYTGPWKEDCRNCPFFCPTQADYRRYESNPTPFNAVLKVFGDAVGQIDTVPLFMAKREELFFEGIDPGQQPLDDFIYLERSLLEGLTFDESGQRVSYSDFGRVGRIQFYWPAVSGADPLTRQTGQYLYTIDASTARTQDKSIGCVPRR